MTPEQKLQYATKFVVGEFSIEKRANNTWIISDHGMILNHSGHWEWEPHRSSQTELFKRRTRYKDLDKVFEIVFKLNNQ